MHNVAFYSNHFAAKTGTGITRYVHNLTEALTALHAPFNIIPVATWSDISTSDLQTLKAKTGLRILPTGRRLTQLLWLLGVGKLENVLDISIDIVHASTVGHLVATSRPYVITVHDLGPLMHPEYFGTAPVWYLKAHLKQAVTQADAFICVSQATADSLVEYAQMQYSVDLSNRIHVVYEGVSERFLDGPDPTVLENLRYKLDISPPYILAVGKISPRKNLKAVIRTLYELRSRIPHHLITVGGDGWDYQETKSMVESLGLVDRVHFLGYVSDETLNALYGEATLFIFPSLFEGFGLPVLEAMASGCPVITSSTSSLPEVAGDAALLVNPHDMGEITAAVEAVCTSQTLLNELRQLGQERAKSFSWQKCAEQTLAIYDQLT